MFSIVFISNRQEALYNPTAKKGIIFHKFRNAKTAASKKAKEQRVENCTMSEKELNSILKYCVVKSDKQKLKQVLRETVDIRRVLLKRGDDDMKDFWTFYFVDVDLVTIFHIDVYIHNLGNTY